MGAPVLERKARSKRAPGISKETWEAEVQALRGRLLELQRALAASKTPLILIVSGADGAGKSETVSRLHEWFDPRGLETHVFGAPTREEAARPEAWRFWMALPARGRIGIFLGSWYTAPILERVRRESNRNGFLAALDRICEFERELSLDGALIVKVWLHLAKKTQKKRLSRLEKSALTRWRVSPVDWRHYRLYDRFIKVSQRAIVATDTTLSPWHVIDATDDRARELSVGRTIARAIERRLKDGVPSPRVALPRVSRSALSRASMSRKTDEQAYGDELARLQGRLSHLSRAAWDKRLSSVLAFEGWDAAGKGGAIRRLTSAMDARLYRVVPIAAPTDEEKARHYLWRFWRALPRPGHITVFDRTWYGRVLVERVEEFTRENDWKRAYGEIRDFEAQLTDAGILLTKFWIHLSKDEQLRRFEERQQIEFKRYKITEEDWRNRKRWDAYVKAVDEAIARTRTLEAPWFVIPGNDKRFARLEILRVACDRFERALA